MEILKKTIVDLIKGFFIGIANIIPGISGGTFALILGIYERLINAIANIDKDFVSGLAGIFKEGLKSSKFRKALRKIDFYFLMRICIGAGISIVILSKVIKYFLVSQHDPTYSFFIGLIIPSIIIPYRMMQRKGFREVVCFLLAIIFLVSISVGFGELKDRKLEIKESTTELHSELIEHTPQHLIFVAFSGALAISAMILPGISGSFILLIMGEYENVLTAINTRDYLFLAVFAFGMFCGIIFFTKLLKLLLKKYHSQTIAFLIGLMIASIYSLFPFKSMIEINGQLFHSSRNILPVINSNFWISVISFFVGFMIVYGFNLIEQKFKK